VIEPETPATSPDPELTLALAEHALREQEAQIAADARNASWERLNALRGAEAERARVEAAKAAHACVTRRTERAAVVQVHLVALLEELRAIDGLDSLALTQTRAGALAHRGGSIEWPVFRCDLAPSGRERLRLLLSGAVLPPESGTYDSGHEARGCITRITGVEGAPSTTTDTPRAADTAQKE